jgi:hypothetical protein
MIIERDWLYVLVDRGGNSYVIQADQVWFCNRIPGHLSNAAFINDDTNMNNSRKQKLTYPFCLRVFVMTLSVTRNL